MTTRALTPALKRYVISCGISQIASLIELPGNWWHGIHELPHDQLPPKLGDWSSQDVFEFTCDINESIEKTQNLLLELPNDETLSTTHRLLMRIADHVPDIDNHSNRELILGDRKYAVDTLISFLNGILDWLPEIEETALQLRSEYVRECQQDENPASSVANGPRPPDKFAWNGTLISGLTPVPWNLLTYCWDSPERCGSYDGMAEAVWGDREYEFAGDPLKAAARKVRDFFRQYNIPLSCSNSERTRTVCIKDSNNGAVSIKGTR